MARHDNLDFQSFGTGNGRVEVVHLKPQKHAISVWLNVRVSDGAMLVLHFPPVQLQNQPAMRNQTFIFRAAVRALATQKMLIPATARFDITHADEGL